MRKIFHILLILFIVVTNSSCASIMNGTSQSVGISSAPSGAKVTIDNFDRGKTPVIVDLKRKDNHIIKIELEGYETYETTLTRKASGWVWGNLALGGLIGLAVDAISGGMYKLTPEQVQATLSKGEYASLNKNDDILFLVTVLNPDSNWQKIGQLQRIK